MKPIILITALLFIVSCNNDDCNCSEARWERTAEYTPTNELYASTQWSMVGSPQNINSSDCSLDGTKGDSGVTDEEVLPSGNTKKYEFEYRITCQ